jgi:hypothetical protein
MIATVRVMPVRKVGPIEGERDSGLKPGTDSGGKPSSLHLQPEWRSVWSGMVRWWQANRSNLVLSEDGLKLVSKRK